MKTTTCAATAMISAVVSAGALGQAGNYPNHVVKFIVPVAAGGTVDIVARTLAQRMTESMGQQVIVENRPSASSLVGTQVVAKSPPDGYTLLATSTTFLSAPAAVREPGNDPIRDFAPISLTCRVPMVLDVSPNLPARSIREFIALAKARPGEITYAASGVGSTGHIAGELFARQAGIGVPNIMKRAMRCHDFGSGLEESPAD